MFDAQRRLRQASCALDDETEAIETEESLSQGTEDEHGGEARLGEQPCSGGSRADRDVSGGESGNSAKDDDEVATKHRASNFLSKKKEEPKMMHCQKGIMHDDNENTRCGGDGHAVEGGRDIDVDGADEGGEITSPPSSPTPLFSSLSLPTYVRQSQAPRPASPNNSPERFGQKTDFRKTDYLFSSSSSSTRPDLVGLDHSELETTGHGGDSTARVPEIGSGNIDSSGRNGFGKCSAHGLPMNPRQDSTQTGRDGGDSFRCRAARCDSAGDTTYQGKARDKESLLAGSCADMFASSGCRLQKETDENLSSSSDSLPENQKVKDASSLPVRSSMSNATIQQPRLHEENELLLLKRQRYRPSF